MSSDADQSPPDVVETTAPPTDDTTPWQRLSSRMIWVDLAQSVLSLTPSAIAIWVVGVEPSWSSLWPLATIAVFGVIGAVGDAMRWVFTRYRVTDDEVQRRTGIVVRRYRSMRRGRIRSVDTSAKLRHRLAGLRIVSIGAGQQTSAGEAALALDAISKPDAEALRDLLLRTGSRASATDGAAASEGEEDTSASEQDVEVFARLRPWWVVYNVFSVWAYLVALGLLWSAFWLLATFGVDTAGFVRGVADWAALGWVTTVVIGLVVVGAIGAVGMVVNFFTQYWRFELARIQREDGSVLRTRNGLLQTREVNRDDARMRGLTISEPLLWRWMGMADTNVITTGLSVWSTSQPATILPRGPVAVAREVAGRVLDERPSPLEVPLPRHPSAALRRRLWWATAMTAAVTAVAALASVLATGAVLPSVIWSGVAIWVVTIVGAVIAQRALGHAIVGPYVVTRSGLMSRSTSALRRDAVSTVAVRQSVLQRRLGLATVSAMTAAGWSIYEAPDVDAAEAVGFAASAAPGLLDPYLADG